MNFQLGDRVLFVSYPSKEAQRYCRHLRRSVPGNALIGRVGGIIEKVETCCAGFTWLVQMPNFDGSLVDQQVAHLVVPARTEDLARGA